MTVVLNRNERRRQQRDERRLKNDPAVRRFIGMTVQQHRQAQARKPITDAHAEDLMTFVHSSITAIAKGQATLVDVVNVCCMVDVSKLIASNQGLGHEYMADIDAAQAAMQAVMDRYEAKKMVLFTGLEMTVMNVWVEIHEAQLNAPAEHRPTEAELMAALRTIKQTDAGRKFQVE